MHLPTLTLYTKHICLPHLTQLTGHTCLALIIITYIYHELISALSVHTIHINLNTIFYTRRAQSYQNNLHKVLYGNTHTHTHTHTHIHTHTDYSRKWVLILVGVEILWKEEGFGSVSKQFTKQTHAPTHLYTKHICLPCLTHHTWHTWLALPSKHMHLPTFLSTMSPLFT